jgi:hypothetical protein
MSKSKARKKELYMSNYTTTWDKAIEDAESMIADAKARIARLRRTVKTFPELRDAGEPWPGTAKSPDQLGSQPSG